MFPDAAMEPHKCAFSDFDHGISMQYSQHRIDMERRGMISISYRIDKIPDKPDGKWSDTKMFSWYDGKKWITLNNETRNLKK